MVTPWLTACGAIESWGTFKKRGLLGENEALGHLSSKGILQPQPLLVSLYFLATVMRGGFVSPDILALMCGSESQGPGIAD